MWSHRLPKPYRPKKSCFGNVSTSSALSAEMNCEYPQKNHIRFYCWTVKRTNALSNRNSGQIKIISRGRQMKFFLNTQTDTQTNNKQACPHKRRSMLGVSRSSRLRWASCLPAKSSSRRKRRCLGSCMLAKSESRDGSWRRTMSLDARSSFRRTTRRRSARLSRMLSLLIQRLAPDATFSVKVPPVVLKVFPFDVHK